MSATLADGAASFSERSRRLDGFSATCDWELGAGLPLPGAGPVLLLLGADGPLLIGAGDAVFLLGAGDAVRWLGSELLPYAKLTPITICRQSASSLFSKLRFLATTAAPGLVQPVLRAPPSTGSI